MATRREILLSGAALAGGALALPGPRTSRAAVGAGARGRDAYWEESYSGGPIDVEPLPPGLPGEDYDPVVVPDGGIVPFRIVDGVKVFHLVVGETEHEFAPGLRAHCWGYDGEVSSRTIEAVEGERVRIYVTNRLPASTSVHWHGMYLPNGMDGVSGLTQVPIRPGETFCYEWTLRQHGTFMFHSHHDAMTQEAMGLTGMFVVHPRRPDPELRVDRDFALLLGTFAIPAGTSRPNPIEDRSFNVLTFNGKAFPGTSPLVVRTGQRVRIRFGNLSAMDHHPIHLHGYRFRIAATDGERIPLTAQWPETSVLVSVGQTREAEFVADAPGDWAMHCHMTHHMMNQMGHDIPNMVGMDAAGIDERIGSLLPGYMTMGTTGMEGMGEMGMEGPPNSIAMKGKPGPFGYIGMGGLVTILKVRDDLERLDRDPGWYDHPNGTVARRVTAAELHRHGIRTDSSA